MLGKLDGDVLMVLPCYVLKTGFVQLWTELSRARLSATPRLGSSEALTEQVRHLDKEGPAIAPEPGL